MTRLTPAALDAALAATDPRVLLVRPRLLRRVIKRHHKLGGLGLRVPHRKSDILSRADLLAIATPFELGISSTQTLPELLILLERPDGPGLDREPAQLLRSYWRLLFHARVHLAFRDAVASGRLTAADVNGRIARIGAVAFDEIRDVLNQEAYLFDPSDDRHVYEEFCAVFLELRHFAPARLSAFFPALDDVAGLNAVLSADLSPESFFAATRPEGASDAPPEEAPPLPEAAPPTIREQEAAPALKRRAVKSAEVGNHVRAAVLMRRAAGAVPEAEAGPVHKDVRRQLKSLADRLTAALHLAPEQHAPLMLGLTELVEGAARGWYPVEARLLYDLQTLCLDVEQPQYEVGLTEFFVSWFRRPIKRPLPDLPLVLVVRRLRRAMSRLVVARMPEDARMALNGVLSDALHHAEARIRPVLLPRLRESLRSVGLVPQAITEELAESRLCEELLDLIVAKGRISIADVRDAIARNRLKMPDLSGPVEFFAGDPLIRVNRDLTSRIDGIYRRGEIYMRWLQRFSSVFFGTVPGRFLTLYLILPFLGAFFLLKGLDVGSEELYKFFGVPRVFIFPPWPHEPHDETKPHAHHPDPPEPGYEHAVLLVAVAAFIGGLLHSSAFRNAVGRGFRVLWRVVRGVFYDLPVAVSRLAVVRRFLASRPFQAAYQFALKPLAVAAPFGAVAYWRSSSLPTGAAVTGGAALGVSLIINSPVGRVVEEAVTDRAAQSWYFFRDNLVLGLFRGVVHLFGVISEYVERAIYRVDETLRFRQGQSSLSFLAKLVLGTAWAAITYVLRVIFYVFFEPQINPIKHFPVVTVSHKLTFLAVPPVADLVAPRFGMGIAEARAAVISVFALIPGMFGFLAWELKENWRLYRANRSPDLDPEIVGSHGEHVINFIRAGFHSGTLPKLFAGLRTSKGKSRRKGRDGLHHAEEELTTFVRRALLDVLSRSSAFGGIKLDAGHAQLATNRIRLRVTGPGGGDFVLSFANRGGKLRADIDRAGWADALTDDRRRVLSAALAGFYKAAGVDIIPTDPAFGATPLAWADWTAYWDAERQGVVPPPLPVAVPLPPAPEKVPT